jgi:hypothetical protein
MCKKEKAMRLKRLYFLPWQASKQRQHIAGSCQSIAASCLLSADVGVAVRCMLLDPMHSDTRGNLRTLVGHCSVQTPNRRGEAEQQITRELVSFAPNDADVSYKLGLAG